MSNKGLFLQNVIAVIWDFDKTLSPHYMQKPLFEAYHVDEDAFWAEVRALPAYYRRAGIHVQPDTCYLGHLLSYVRHGRMPDLTNARLRELGADIEFFPGIPELFDRLSTILHKPQFQDGDLRLEHYVVSTGLVEIVRGSVIASRLDGIWASEFIETPAAPEGDLGAAPSPGPICQIAGFLDHTTKTRALFEINKGVNKHPQISVNDSISEEQRRVPFKNMIYIADGPSDIPSFSVVRKHGGLTCAVYAPESKAQFAQVTALLETGRVDMIGPADYREGSQTDMWLQLQVFRIAQRMMDERKRTTERSVGRGPSHLESSPLTS
ncbi:MAG: haloacid dehalogenase-like hydrolase [Candidatus Hydrogenedentes bacterium]|nr:haloacid dehalogenase-like hydrolase [Candidatus Hydrogenedentota bacterium]